MDTEKLLFGMDNLSFLNVADTKLLSNLLNGQYTMDTKELLIVLENLWFLIVVDTMLLWNLLNSEGTMDAKEAVEHVSQAGAVLGASSVVLSCNTKHSVAVDVE